MSRLPQLTGEAVSTLYARLRAENPDPESELDHKDAYTLLVAVVLSAQATDKSVNRATPALFARADTPQGMLALGEAGVAEKISSIGLFRNKARNLVALSKRLVEMHGGAVPDTRESLEALPGVGRKSANVVLNVWFKKPVMAVDTHVFRVANRTGLAPGKNPGEVEKGLMAVTPSEYALGAHHWLVLHGRYVCKARKPDCNRCIIRDVCLFGEKTPPESAS